MTEQSVHSRNLVPMYLPVLQVIKINDFENEDIDLPAMDGVGDADNLEINHVLQLKVS